MAEVAVLTRGETCGLGEGDVLIEDVEDKLFQTFPIGGFEGEGGVVACEGL